MFKRLRGFINRVLGRQPPPTLPEVAPPVEPVFVSPVFEEPPSLQPIEQPPGTLTIEDDFGVVRGTQTVDQWYADTLLTKEEFHAKFGQDFDNIDLIYLLEEYLEIDWDWQAWREAYAARNG